jgi:hypothetical protein
MTTTQNTAPRTIARNAYNQIAAIKATVATAQVYDLATNFDGHTVDIAGVWEHFDWFDGTRVLDNGDGTYTIRYHSNLWIKLSA